MREFIEQLSPKSCHALATSIGCPIQSILSPSADIYLGVPGVIVQNISIRIGIKKFLVIENDWSDTPREAHDYYFLEASLFDKPKGIVVNEQNKSPCWSYLMDHFSLHLGAQSKIKKIQILEYVYSGNEELVQYDAGLIFTLENSAMFSITREESISGFMQMRCFLSLGKNQFQVLCK